MDRKLFGGLFSTLPIAIIACARDGDLTVRYANQAAALMTGCPAPEGGASFPLSKMLGPGHERIGPALAETGAVILGQVAGRRGEAFALRANAAILAGEPFYILYLFPHEFASEDTRNIEALLSLLSTSYHTASPDSAVRAILATVGDHLGVSRVYIYEDTSREHVVNRYEWCATGIEPATEQYTTLNKNIFPYRALTSGVYTGDDPANAPGPLKKNGVQAIACAPLFHQDAPLGFVGIDECKSPRRWTPPELRFLQDVAAMLSSLLGRRNAERTILSSNRILQTITENIDSYIFVADLDTYRIKFINRAYAAMLGKDPQELIGHKCYEVLQKDMDGPCPFCPLLYLANASGEAAGGAFECEIKNTINGNWYWAKDSIIPWIDGVPVHMQTAVDITYRKQYEEQLRHFASIDAMTGTFNREWGYKLLKKKLVEARITGNEYTLCFIDLDGLKIVNDTFGHAFGDEMIQKIVQVIRANVRGNDMLCRWGGDEFLLLLHCNAENAGQIMQKITHDVQRVNENREQPYILSFSYGIQDFRRGDSADSVDSIITAADNKMYRNKTEKRAGGATQE